MNKILIAFVLVAGIGIQGRVAVPQNMIDEINKAQNLWRAVPNPVSKLPQEVARTLLGTPVIDPMPEPGVEDVQYPESALADLPENFDARKQWPNCSTIRDIRNQKHCGSCWAFGAVEAMSDRQCIHKKEVVALSAEDMNSCSTEFLIRCGNCKSGGRPGCAWAYWVSHGVVSERCYPYTAGNTSELITPPCLSHCTGDTSLKWETDKRMGQRRYTTGGEKNIMNEIYQNGPIEVAFQVYTDFMAYGEGVYIHTSGKFEGGHAVKMLGWGVEGGIKYWLCANSWDVTWGDKGFFRIRRGTNECGIESTSWAGIPK